MIAEIKPNEVGQACLIHPSLESGHPTAPLAPWTRAFVVVFVVIILPAVAVPPPLDAVSFKVRVAVMAVRALYRKEYVDKGREAGDKNGEARED